MNERTSVCFVFAPLILMIAYAVKMEPKRLQNKPRRTDVKQTTLWKSFFFSSLLETTRAQKNTVRCSKEVSNIQSHGIWFSLKIGDKKNGNKKKWKKITQDILYKWQKRYFRKISVKIMMQRAVCRCAPNWRYRKRLNYRVIKCPK